MRHLMLLASVFAVAATPVIASEAPLSSKAFGHSTAGKSVRAGSKSSARNGLADAGFIIVIAAALAVGGGIYLAIDGDDNANSN